MLNLTRCIAVLNLTLENRHFQLIKTVFWCRKGSGGETKYYVSTADATINQEKIDTIYGGFKKGNTYYFEDLTKFHARGESWNTFPTNTVADQLGFAIASLLLMFKGGERTIKIDFSKSDGTELILDIDDYNFHLSAEEGWFKLSNPCNKESTLELLLMRRETEDRREAEIFIE